MSARDQLWDEGLIDPHDGEAEEVLAQEVLKLRRRCREAAQVLIERIGADGPEDVVETAKRAAAVLDNASQRLESFITCAKCGEQPRLSTCYICTNHGDII
jgi:hypothetical protein